MEGGGREQPQIRPISPPSASRALSADASKRTFDGRFRSFDLWVIQLGRGSCKQPHDDIYGPTTLKCLIHCATVR